ncbi:MAG: hypothetical protein EBS85_03840 [Micrococcales bacterium]|nr:hypothetical protein [Actinomycetota bacterium]NCA07842.1 hypothetical protein [Micrococcales bacterium]
MATSTRIKATNISFKIGSTEYNCDANMVELTLNDAPGDVQTFCEVRTGGEWKLQIDGVTSGDSASLYRILWANFGTTVAFTIAPNGNASASTSQPHYTGSVIFDTLPPLSLSSGEITKFSVTLTVLNSVHTPSTTPPVYYGVTLKTA